MGFIHHVTQPQWKNPRAFEVVSFLHRDSDHHDETTIPSMMPLVNPLANVAHRDPISLLTTAGFVTTRNFKLQDTPDLSGKIAVVTGGAAGIGKEMTAQLLLHGIAKVFVIARTESRFTAARTDWADKSGLTTEDLQNRTEFVQCDLSDIVSVKNCVDILRPKLQRLDILVNNAGGLPSLMALFVRKLIHTTGKPPTQDYFLSPQGVESIFATNHIGHYVLTLLLLPLIETTGATHGSARIVTTSSSLHLVCQELDLALLKSDKPTKSPASFDSVWRYGRSKLANVLFTKQLATLLSKKGAENVYANCFFPGNIPTEAMDTWQQLFGTLAGKALKGGFKLVGQSPEDAAATAIFLAASTDVEIKQLKGKYFVPIATEYETSTTADDKDLAKNLWYWSDHQVSEVLGKTWQEAAS